MKKYLIFFALLASALALTAQTKKVAVMDTKAHNGVKEMHAIMIRGGMETAVGNTSGYEVYDRSSFDDIMKEHNFQRSGAVKDSDIKRLGEMAGVQYIIVPEAVAEGDEIYIIVKMLDVETGRFVKSTDQLCEATSTHIREACAELGVQLFGTSGIATPVHSQYQQTITPNQSYKQELQLSDGRYVGEVSNGKPHGKGIIYFKSDDKLTRVSYEGDWVDGIKNGNGIMLWKNGQRFVGNWKNGIIDGTGTVYWKNGNRYEGIWKDGYRNGSGTHYWSNGDKDMGTFLNEKREGEWIRIKANGKKLKAKYKNGEIIKDWH